MRAINHALTGGFLGLAIGRPLVAVPLAIASHFVCDALPHYDSSLPAMQRLKTRLFQNQLLIDAALCVLFVLVLVVFRPQHWLLAAMCAFLATSPDLLWINMYRHTRSGRPWRRNWYTTFAGRIQWFQRPIGALVEVAWFIAGIVLLAPFFR